MPPSRIDTQTLQASLPKLPLINAKTNVLTFGPIYDFKLNVFETHFNFWSTQGADSHPSQARKARLILKKGQGKLGLKCKIRAQFFESGEVQLLEYLGIKL